MLVEVQLSHISEIVLLKCLNLLIRLNYTLINIHRLEVAQVSLQVLNQEVVGHPFRALVNHRFEIHLKDLIGATHVYNSF